MKIELNMENIMNKKVKKTYESTYQRLMNENPVFKKEYPKVYKQFLLSELILAIMKEDETSVRKLAKAAGVSPSLLQDLKTGKKDNLTLRSFSNILGALGYNLIIEKDKRKRSKSAIEIEVPKTTNYIYLRK